MLHREIILPPENLRVGTAQSSLAARIEEICRREGLGASLKTTLREHPGCLHWHWKRGRENGTLEVTHWPQENRVWISVHENRAAPWTDALAERLATILERQLGGEADRVSAQEKR